MRLRRRKEPLSPDLAAAQEVADELWSTSRRLIGWTTTGTGGLPVDSVLERGAREIERLIASAAAEHTETEKS